VAGNTAPQKDYVDAQGILQLGTLDVSTTTYVPDPGYAVRLRWLYASLQDSGGVDRLTVQLNISPGGDAPTLHLHAVPANISNNQNKVLWSNEVGTPIVIADATGAGTQRLSYNPLPLVTIDQSGSFTLGFNNGDLINAPVFQVELFQVPKGQGRGAADLYLLPGFG
jgi:hypothetical protein